VRRARFDDLTTGQGLVFGACERVVVAHRADEVRGALAEVDAATRAGAWAFGHVAYEAATGLDPVLPVVPGDGPLVWFGLGPAPAPAIVPAVVQPVGVTGPATRSWRPADDLASYQLRFDAVRAAIADGLTYECNLTTRFTGELAGTPEDLYAELAWAQRGAYAALLRQDERAIVSASPELFFEWSGSDEGGRIRTRPMKGTARRGATPAADRAARAGLLRAEKERAENVIVVDLLRNDLSRLARTGGVRVQELLTAERYETVWQLTSEIHADVRPDVGLLGVFEALFPCGSITGAPKAETMRLIRDVEAVPRGVYCGAIGFVAPPEAAVRARFSVAIRTVVADLATGRCHYGVGSGITWGSDLLAEFDELDAKTAVLSGGRRRASRDRVTAAATRTAAAVRATS
jgi:para-aminobenzoate synthetase/4-amino-4-deoxychorismate lyase